MDEIEEWFPCPYEDKKVKVIIQKHPVLAEAQTIYICKNSQSCTYCMQGKCCKFNSYNN